MLSRYNKKVQIIDEQKLIEAAMDALVRKLGPVEAMRFMALFRNNREDMVKRHRKCAQTQAARKTEGRQKTHAPDRSRGDSPGSFHGGAEDGGVSLRGKMLLATSTGSVIMLESN